MKEFLQRIIVTNWQRKCMALAFAVIIWVLVDHSIMTTKTFPNVPVKLLNIPRDKTIEGLLPNGTLSKRITLMLTGSKAMLDELQSKDLEVVIDATGKGLQWILEVTRKDIVCLDKEVDLQHNLTEVNQNEYVIRLQKLITQKIPVYIKPPVGEAPQGYQFLDIWPQELTITLSGPEDQVIELKEKGLELTFDLNEISKHELDDLDTSHHGAQEDEIIFYVPSKWKRIPIPFLGNSLIVIDDPEAKYLHIDFLRNALIPLMQDVPISIFYPLGYSATINPTKYPKITGDFVTEQNGIYIIPTPLYVRDVSRLFLDIVRNYMQIIVTALPSTEGGNLDWSVQFIDPQRLEDEYLAQLRTDFSHTQATSRYPRRHIRYLSERFRKYMRSLQFFKEDGEEFYLKAKLLDNEIRIDDTSDIRALKH